MIFSSCILFVYFLSKISEKLVHKVASNEDIPKYVQIFLSILLKTCFGLLNIILLLVLSSYYLTHIAFAIIGSFFVKILMRP